MKHLFKWCSGNLVNDMYTLLTCYREHVATLLAFVDRAPPVPMLTLIWRRWFLPRLTRVEIFGDYICKGTLNLEKELGLSLAMSQHDSPILFKFSCDNV